VKINVTKDDIRRGFRQNAWLCPVARAVRRAVGPGPRREICVTESSINVGERRLGLPPGVGGFICRFDLFEKVRPFSFTLPLRRRQR